MLKLKYLRLKMGVSQKELESQLGLTHAFYSAIENGRMTNPYLSTVLKLQSIFKLSWEALSKEAMPEEVKECQEFERKLRSRSGRKGGTVTSLLYGRKYMKEIGKRGAKASEIREKGKTEKRRRTKARIA